VSATAPSEPLPIIIWKGLLGYIIKCDGVLGFDYFGRAHAAVRFLPFCFMGGYDKIYTVVFTRAGLLKRSPGQKKSSLCDFLIQGD